MALRHSYSVLAPLYDTVVRGPLDQVRRKSLARLKDIHNKDILINGIGTGLDIEYLPRSPLYRIRHHTINVEARREARKSVRGRHQAHMCRQPEPAI